MFRSVWRTAGRPFRLFAGCGILPGVVLSGRFLSGRGGGSGCGTRGSGGLCLLGLPDVDLRFGAGAQPLDILAVRVEQQDGDDEREDDERDGLVHLGRDHRECGEAASGDHRRERDVVRDHEHDEPHAEAEQCHRGVDSRDGPDERGDALPAAESGEDGEDVSEHGGEHGDDLEVDEPHVADVLVVLEHLDERDGDESLQEVEREDGQCGPAAQHAEHVGRSGVFRAVFADVDAVVFLADPHGARNRAQQIGDDNHGGSGIVRQYHGRLSGKFYWQI